MADALKFIQDYENAKRINGGRGYTDKEIATRKANEGSSQIGLDSFINSSLDPKPKQYNSLREGIQSMIPKKTPVRKRPRPMRYFAVSDGASEHYSTLKDLEKDLPNFDDAEVRVYTLKNTRDVSQLGSDDLLYTWKNGVKTR